MVVSQKAGHYVEMTHRYVGISTIVLTKLDNIVHGRIMHVTLHFMDTFVTAITFYSTGILCIVNGEQWWLL